MILGGDPQVAIGQATRQLSDGAGPTSQTGKLVEQLIEAVGQRDRSHAESPSPRRRFGSKMLVALFYSGLDSIRNSRQPNRSETADGNTRLSARHR